MNAIEHDTHELAVQAKLDKVQRELDQQRAWRHDLEREIAAVKRDNEELRGQIFVAKAKVAQLERSREWGRRRSERCMASSPGLHGKVERWLALREEWISATTERMALVSAWHELAIELGAGHPATLGVLLAIVREAWCYDGLRPEKHDSIWVIRDGVGGLIGGPNGTAFFTEDDAIVAAMLVAPVPTSLECATGQIEVPR